jgi:hypothetical protein
MAEMAAAKLALDECGYLVKRSLRIEAPKQPADNLTVNNIMASGDFIDEPIFNFFFQFPHLNYQKRIVEKSLKRQNHDAKRQAWAEETQAERKRLGLVIFLKRHK